MAAEMFLAGLSTRDVGRVLERHFGDRFDSKEISRMVAATSGELDAWRTRNLAGTRYRFLYLDGTNFKVRRGDIVERLPVLVVIGAREDTDRLEVLAVEMGEREHTESWEGVFADLARRGLDVQGVELGVMDGLPGLEGPSRVGSRAAAPNAVRYTPSAMLCVGLPNETATRFAATLTVSFTAREKPPLDGRSSNSRSDGEQPTAVPSASSNATWTACFAFISSPSRTGRAYVRPIRSNG